MSRKLETEAAGPYCVICEFVMKELDRIIGENKTEVDTFIILICEMSIWKKMYIKIFTFLLH